MFSEDKFVVSEIASFFSAQENYNSYFYSKSEPSAAYGQGVLVRIRNKLVSRASPFS